MFVRGIRGAITVEENTSKDILAGTKELLMRLIADNQLETENIVSIIFSTTKDLNAVFPAKAARHLGLSQVPLLCCHEMEVPISLERCIRVLMHVNTTQLQSDIEHIYLKGAAKLRPEYSVKGDDDI